MLLLGVLFPYQYHLSIFIYCFFARLTEERATGSFTLLLGISSKNGTRYSQHITKPKKSQVEKKRRENKKKRGEIGPCPQKSPPPKINGQEAHHVFSGKPVSPTDILTAHHFVCRVKPDLSLTGLPKNILPPQHWESRMLGKVVYVCM